MLLVNPLTDGMLINVFFGGEEILPFFNKEIGNMFVFQKSPKFEYQEKKEANTDADEFLKDHSCKQ